LPVVVTTSEPSLSTNVAAVTPEPTEPSAITRGDDLPEMSPPLATVATQETETHRCQTGHALSVTSITSLFRCPAADVTLARVRELVDQSLPESLTLEYKERFSSSLVTTVAAMANSYGGIVLVGIVDSHANERIVGVSESAVTQIANACHDALEPPWEPEIVPVRLPDSVDAYVLVIRVDPTRAPRPLLVDGYAPVRLHGRNAKASRDRLSQLFSESALSMPAMYKTVPAPQLPREDDASAAADFMMRSGMQLPVGESATWRPLSERGVDALAAALNNSAVNQLLVSRCAEFGISGFNPFSSQGFNRARHARLEWQGVVDGTVPYPIEAIAEAHLPNAYGVPSSLQFTLDIVVRVRVAQRREGIAPPMPLWRLTPFALREFMTGIIAGLTEPAVVSALADLADIDPIRVPQPANLTLLTGPAVRELLNVFGLVSVAGAGDSYGASLLSNPTLDLSDARERIEQVESWMTQVALDAGLRGMEQLLSRIHLEEQAEAGR
jgi:hypothetical protein